MLAGLADTGTGTGTSPSISSKFINEYDQMIYDMCVQLEMSEYYGLAIAIARLETSHYSSEVFINNNNFGGMFYVDHYMKFSTLEEGCKAYVEMLKYGYIDLGLDSAQTMQKKYCPGNDNWTNIVEKLISEIEKN